MSDVVRGTRVGVAVTWMGSATCTEVVAVAWMSAAARGVDPVAPRSHAERRNPASITPGTSTRSEALFADRRSSFLPTAPSLWDVLGVRHRANVTAGGGRKVLEALPEPHANGLRPCRVLQYAGDEKRKPSSTVLDA